MIIQNDREDEGCDQGDEGKPKEGLRGYKGGWTVGLVDPGEGSVVQGAVELDPNVDLQVTKVVFVVFVPNRVDVIVGVRWIVEVRPVCPGEVVLSPRLWLSPTVVSPIVDELRLASPVNVELTRWDDRTRFWFFQGGDVSGGGVLHLPEGFLNDDLVLPLVTGNREFKSLFVQEEDGEGVGELVVVDASLEREWGAEDWVVDPNAFEAKVKVFSSEKSEEFSSLLGTTEEEAIEVGIGKRGERS